METTKVKIDEAHSLDIIDGKKLEEQPYEAQDIFNNYIVDNNILLWWKPNADVIDEVGRPTYWCYEWGELVCECKRVYKYSGEIGHHNWTPISETIILSANNNIE